MMNNAIEKKLKERWARTLSRSAAELPQELIIGSFGEIRRHYSEKHRYYHNLSHIVRCLDLFDAVSKNTKDPLSLEIAIWLHDGIYDTDSTDNEERSAEFASSLLSKLTLPQKRIERVQELILATKHVGREAGRETTGPAETDSAYMQDIDLSILGAPPDEYKDYSEAVRQEYAQYTEKQFNAGRVTLLLQFLEKVRIYKTEFFFSRFEARARENLYRELRERDPSESDVNLNQ